MSGKKNLVLLLTLSLILVTVAAQCAPAPTPEVMEKVVATPTPMAAPTTAPKPAGRPDWVTAAKPYQGLIINGVTASGSWGDVHVKLAEEFSTLTGIDVRLDIVPSGETYYTKLQAEVLGRSGNLQFFAIPLANITLYYEGGVLQDLTPYLSDPRFPDYKLDEYPENIVDLLMRREGKIVGLFATGSPQIMFYRTDLLQEAGLKPPSTWQELPEAAKKLQKGDIYGASWELKGNYPVHRLGNLLPCGLDWLDEEMRLSALRDPRTIENMKVWQRMYQEGLIPKDVMAYDLAASLTLFTTGKAAILPLSWVSQMETAENPDQSQVAGKVGYAPVPGGCPNATGWVYSISIDADEQMKEAAYLFVSWLSSKETSIRQIEGYGLLDASVRRGVLTDELKQEVLKQPNGASRLEAVEAMNQSWSGARFTPTIPEWPTIIVTLSPILQKTIAGDLSAEEGLNMAADEAEKILAEAGYYK